ncbi:coenzyme F430 synthase, partial [Methanofollis fontis]
GAVAADEIAVIEEERCSYCYGGIEGMFEHPLLSLRAYREPLRLATAAACMLGIDPAPLSGFAALPGRMAISQEGQVLIVDNASSGACRETAIEAAAYARRLAGAAPLTLVIGTEGRTICEGFPVEEVRAAIREIAPAQTVTVGDYSDVGDESASDLTSGIRIARRITQDGGVILLAVKSWR